MEYEQLISAMKRFGSTERDICMCALGVPLGQIKPNVVIAPWWEPSVFSGLGEIEYISASGSPAVKVWDIRREGVEITYIRTGIGAPVLMDAVLSLGLTACKNIIFAGSAGALDSQIGIGDIVIPGYSVCGTGASRYLAQGRLGEEDVFGKKIYPDTLMLKKTEQVTGRICRASGVKWHTGRNFSIDTIFAQFAHIDDIINTGCNVIEMETSAAFRAAEVAGIAISAVFSVSDNTVTNKSLICGRTEREREYRSYVRREIFPQIIFGIFEECAVKIP